MAPGALCPCAERASLFNKVDMLTWLLVESVNWKHLILHCVQISCHWHSPLRSHLILLFQHSPANIAQHFTDICSRFFPEGTLPFIQQLFFLLFKFTNFFLQTQDFTFITGYARPNTSFEPISNFHRFEFQLTVLVQLCYFLTFS